MLIALSLVLATAVGVLSFGHTTVRQGAFGAFLGLAGGTFILRALHFCPFAPDAEATEGVLGVALAAAFGWIAAAAANAIINRPTDQPRPGQLQTASFRLGAYWPWLLLSPTLVVLAVFLYLPAYNTFTLSTKLTRLGAPRAADRCLSNYSELLIPNPTLVVVLPMLSIAAIWAIALLRRRTAAGTGIHRLAVTLQPVGIALFLLALYFIFEGTNGGYRLIYLNTLIISSTTVIFSMAAGLALAYLTFGHIRGITVYRTLLIWPYAISPPVAGILFFMMFNATGGIFAAVSENWLGLDFPNYAQDANLARLTIVLASVWKLLGYNLLFFLAGLQTVPREQIEAAALDGANARQRFVSIVLPALGPIAFFLLITNLTYTFFDVYGTIDFLTKGAPAGATSVPIYEIIRVGVDNRDLGRGAAQSVVLFLAVIGLTAWQFRQADKRVSYAGG